MRVLSSESDSEKRTVLITGCSSGFGKLLVHRFLSAGWSVIATMRGAEKRQHIFEDESGRHPGDVRILELDLTNPSQIEKVSSSITRLDCLINNAGYGMMGPFEEISDEQLRSQFEVNFFGAATLTRTLLPALRVRQGQIINISSTFGFTGFPLSSAYCSSKFALEGLFESLSYELASQGIRISIVEPGGHRTEFGRNIQWSEDHDTDFYQVQKKGYKDLFERLMKRTPVPAANVVMKVFEIAEKGSSKLRIRVGHDAVATYWLKRVLPSRMYTSFMMRVSSRMSGIQP